MKRCKRAQAESARFFGQPVQGSLVTKETAGE